VVLLSADGYSQKEIARIVRMTRKTVACCLKSYNLSFVQTGTI